MRVLGVRKRMDGFCERDGGGEGDGRRGWGRHRGRQAEEARSKGRKKEEGRKREEGRRREIEIEILSAQSVENVFHRSFMNSEIWWIGEWEDGFAPKESSQWCASIMLCICEIAPTNLLFPLCFIQSQQPKTSPTETIPDRNHSRPTISQTQSTPIC